MDDETLMDGMIAELLPAMKQKQQIEYMNTISTDTGSSKQQSAAAIVSAPADEFAEDDDTVAEDEDEVSEDDDEVAEDDDKVAEGEDKVAKDIAEEIDTVQENSAGNQLNRGTYTLPKFPPSVVSSLTAKQRGTFQIGFKQRRSVITCLFEDLIARNIWYPTRRTYAVVIDTLLMKYSFLLDFDGTSESWRHSLRAKFKNERRLLTSNEAVERMKVQYGRKGGPGRKKRSSNHVDVLVKKSRSNMEKILGAAHVLGEDEHSIRQHMAVIICEGKKEKPNLKLLADQMRRTVAHRQKLCMEAKTRDVLKQYPILKMHIFLIGDALLMYDIMTEMLESVVKLIERMKEVLKYKKHVLLDLKQHEQQLEADMKEAVNEETRLDLKLGFAVRFLVECLSERSNCLFLTSDEEISATPSICQMRDTWTVHFDGQVLLQNVATYSKALQAWYAVFWVFHVEYPESLKNTCFFLEKYIFKRQVSVPAAVNRLANKILPFSS